MYLIDIYLNSNAFNDADNTSCGCVFQRAAGTARANHPSSPTTTQVARFASPWTASFPEITGKIFVGMRDVLRSNHPNQQSAWLRLMRVCRAWRQLVLDTPALWTHLRMYNIAYTGQLARLLSRSGDFLVNLELNFVKSRLVLSASKFEVCVQHAVWLHGHRIASFDVICSSGNLVPIRSVETALYFPDRVEVSLEPGRTSDPWNVVRLRGGSFPRLSGLLQDGEANTDAFRVFRAVGEARRHNLVEHTFWQVFGHQIPQVLHTFWSLTHIYLEYCGPQDRQASLMEMIYLPSTFRSLTIIDEPWAMQTLLSHISIGFTAHDCERIRIKLAVDLSNPTYSSRYALQDLLLAIQWPSIYFHVSVCSAVLLNLASDYTLTLAGFDAEHRSKFQFDFFNCSDQSAILELAADTLNDYYKIFVPHEPPSPKIPWFSQMRQLSIHDASGELGRLLDWDAFVCSLPRNVRSLSLGDARVVAGFLDAMDALAHQVAGHSAASRRRIRTVRLSRLAWCVSGSLNRGDVAIVQRCCALRILAVGEVVLRVARQVDDVPGSPHNPSTPLPSPPPSDDLPFGGRARMLRVENGHRCSICRTAPRWVL